MQAEGEPCFFIKDKAKFFFVRRNKNDVASVQCYRSLQTPVHETLPKVKTSLCGNPSFKQVIAGAAMLGVVAVAGNKSWQLAHKSINAKDSVGMFKDSRDAVFAFADAYFGTDALPKKITFAIRPCKDEPGTMMATFELGKMRKVLQVCTFEVPFDRYGRSHL